MKRVVFLCVALMMAGCQTVRPQPATITQVEMKRLISQNKYRLFREPESLRHVSISQPAFHAGTQSHWVCIEATGRNAFGGMTGLTNVVVTAFNDGRILSEPDPHGFCSGVPATPWGAFPN